MQIFYFVRKIAKKEVIMYTVFNSECSAKGKVMIAADKGQYAMVDATGDTATLVLKEVPEGKCKLYVYHDENGNYQLDRVDGVPTENCAIVDLDMTVEAKTIDVELADLRNKAKK